MPQNIVDADTWTVTVQVAADGDAVNGASQVLIGQDLADRTRYMKNRWDALTGVFMTGAGTPGTAALVENVAAGAASGTVVNTLGAGDVNQSEIWLVMATIRAQVPAALAAPPYTWSFYLYENNAAAALGNFGQLTYDQITTNNVEPVTIHLLQWVQITGAQAAAGLDIRLWNGSAQAIDLWSPWSITPLILRP